MPRKKREAKTYKSTKKNDDYKLYKNKRLKNIKSANKIDEENNKKRPSSSRKKKSIKIKNLFSEDDNKNVFNGIKIVMTGVFSNFKDRSDLAEILKNLGAKVTTGVSGVTDVLIHGYELEDGREVSDSRKYKIAQQKGTLIYSEQDFFKEYEKKTGKTLLNNSEKSKSYKDFRKKKTSKKLDEEINQKSDKTNKKVKNLLWVDQFKPINSSDILGNKNETKKLKNWLRNYYSHKKNGKTRQKEKSKQE